MENEKTSLIIGYGEIGSSLEKVLKTVRVNSRAQKLYNVDIYDPYLNMDTTKPDHVYDVMHICFPPVKNFEKIVKSYIKRFNPKYTVIHSTVPVGTSKRLGVFHSPVRGVHPNIAKGIKTFVKYLAPKSKFLKEYFEKANITIHNIESTNTTESIKIWDTTYYGWNIIFEKILHEWCKENKVNFDVVYTHANETYNIGYTKLGRLDVVRPVLKHMNGEIGGHCVIPNLALFDSPIGDFIKQHNERFKVSKVWKGAGKGIRRSKRGNRN